MEKRSAELWADGRRCEPVDDGPVQMESRRGSGELGVRVGANLGAAAAQLRHVAAVVVHGAAAGALLLVHGAGRHAGKNRCGSGEQEQQRDDASEATHKLTIRLRALPACPGSGQRSRG